MENKKKIESEINYKALIKKPIRLFGLVYIYFFVVALAIGLYYLNVMDTSSFNTVPGTSLDTLNIIREVNTKVGGIKPAMDLGLITNPTANLISFGKKQYEAVYTHIVLEADADVMPKFENDLYLNQDVIRHLLVLAEVVKAEK